MGYTTHKTQTTRANEQTHLTTHPASIIIQHPYSMKQKQRTSTNRHFVRKCFFFSAFFFVYTRFNYSHLELDLDLEEREGLDDPKGLLALA